MSMSASLLRRSVELYQEGKKEEANDLLKAVVLLEPDNQVARNWYIETLTNPQERKRALEEYLRLYPNSQQATKALAALKQQEVVLERVPVRLEEPVQPAPPPPTPQPAAAQRSAANVTPRPAQPHRSSSYASILAVFSVVLLAALLVYTVRLQQRRDMLQGRFDELQTGYTNLRVAHEVTVQEKEQLATRLDDLWVDYDYLNTTYNSLAAAYSDLESRFNGLAQAFFDLDSQHKVLTQDYSTLEGKYADMKSNYQALSGEYDVLRANYTNLYGWYEWLQTNAVKPPYIAIHNRQVTLGFYGPYGTVETWTKDVSELENAIITGEYYRDNPTRVTIDLNGQNDPKDNYAPFVDPRPFREYISYLYNQSGGDYAFIQNVRQIIGQLTIYKAEDQQTPRHPLETFLLGGGDCEDTSILLASMLLAAPVDWEVSLVYMDYDHPKNAQTLNHVIVYVDTGKDEYLIESTNPDSYWSDIQGWYLDVSDKR